MFNSAKKPPSKLFCLVAEIVSITQSKCQFMAEIIRHFQLGNESNEHVNHALHVGHISCLYRAVHVAQREREIGGGHAAAGAENLVGIGTGSDELKLSPCACIEIELPKDLPEWFIATI
jgi:hypothetical protein